MEKSLLIRSALCESEAKPVAGAWTRIEATLCFHHPVPRPEILLRRLDGLAKN